MHLHCTSVLSASCYIKVVGLYIQTGNTFVCVCVCVDLLGRTFLYLFLCFSSGVSGRV